MKDVLALLSPTPGNRLSSGAHYALGLARANGAHLSALIAEIESINLPPEPDTMQACDTGVELPSLAEQLGRTAELVLSAAKAADVSCEIVATDALCRYLARWSIAAKLEAINREKLAVGTALLTYAEQADANLLVMGGFAHEFKRELMLGSATRDVFRAALEMPVLLSH